MNTILSTKNHPQRGVAQNQRYTCERPSPDISAPKHQTIPNAGEERPPFLPQAMRHPFALCTVPASYHGSRHEHTGVEGILNLREAGASAATGGISRIQEKRTTIDLSGNQLCCHRPTIRNPPATIEAAYIVTVAVPEYPRGHVAAAFPSEHLQHKTRHRKPRSTLHNFTSAPASTETALNVPPCFPNLARYPINVICKFVLQHREEIGMCGRDR